MTKTPPRSIRVPDELWRAARERAAAEGTTVSAIVSAALRGTDRTQDDLLDRYRELSAAESHVNELLDRLTDLQARALAELHADGWSYARIAHATGLTRARVQQLVTQENNR